jgi:hypothetical protein
MPVRLLGDHEPIDHSLWNDLFAEFDRKLTVAMDDKTWLLCHDPAVLTFMGMVFKLGAGGPQSAWMPGPQYDHARFRSVADQAAIELYDSANTIVMMTDAVPADIKASIGLSSSEFYLDHSLEAHRRLFAEEDGDLALYWLLEPPGPGFNLRMIPQKIYRFALAELVLEGPGLEWFVFDQAWNKFNCFRLHNCNPYHLVVDFGGQYQLTVPRYACRTLRRIPIDWPPTRYTYEPGYNYFLKFRSGDPRLYSMPHDPGTPFGTQGANNITSPALVIHRVLDAFSSSYGLGGTASIGGPKWLRDPYQLCDVSEMHGGFFPAG